MWLAGQLWGVDYRSYVLTAVCIVPATPLMAPELGGSAAAELAVLREHVLAAARGLAARSERWTVLGAQGAQERPAAESVAGRPVGTFAGFGVDLRVSLAAASADAASDARMSLPLLLAGWIRDAIDASPVVTAELVDPTTSARDCLTAGRRLGTSLGESSQREGVLIVADGPTTLTEKAPGSFDPRAARLDAELRTAFESGDASYLADMDEELCTALGAEGRAPWQMLAGLLGELAVRASGVYAEAPYGVGYYTGLWLPTSRLPASRLP